MKFNISSKTFYQSAAAVSKVISNKNALAILDNFLLDIDAEAKVLTITGSDQENALSARVAIEEAAGSGSVCVGARRLVELLKELPEQGITISINDDTLEMQITYQAGHFAFVCLPGTQYPRFEPEISGEPAVFTIAAEQMVTGLDNTMFAAATEEYRQAMMGVRFDVTPDKIVFAATDTRKLVRFVDSRTAPDVTASGTIPAKAAGIIKNVLAGEDNLKITMYNKSALLETEHISFQLTFLGGNYPDYNRVIPRNNPNILTIERQAFLNAVRRVGIFVEVEGGLEKFRFAQDSVLIKSSDPNLCSSAREQVPCNYSGNELTIGFNASYLIEILGTLKTQEIAIELGDAARPGVFKPMEEPENTQLVIILMPMTVSDF